ncbi:MFS transporter [Pseudonocardia alni]|uniref:MFS transporter n=1 Tax=Pseudonocardia alni TaxID=33907 RepID=UPI0033C592EE
MTSTVSSPPATAVRRWRRALFAMFAVFGLSLASWITRTPDIRDAVGASTAQMGLILAGLSVGSIVGITSAGRAVGRFGTRPVLIASGSATIAGLATVATGTATGSAVLVGLGLGLFGLGMGCSEVAINVDGATVEQVTGRSVLPVLHGCFSLGTFLGALAGMGFSAMALPVTAHLASAAVAVGATTVWALRGVPGGLRGGPDPDGAPVASVWRDRGVLLIGVVVLGMAFAEGTANDWLPLIAVDGFGTSTTVGSFAFALFALVMAVGRFCGPWLLGRFGRSTAVRVTAGLAAVGIAVVMLAPTMAVGSVGIVLWGLGTSLGFPVALSAAGDHPRDSAARVSAVATVGYLAFLAGPPLLGLLGEAIGLRQAIGVVVVLVALAAICAPAARERTPERG